MAKERYLPHVDYRKLVKANSARIEPIRFQIIVVHDTEGANLKGIRDLVTLGDIFDEFPNGNPALGRSAHVGVDDEGKSARYVADLRKAWSCVHYNSVSLNIEHIGFASGPHSHFTDEQYREGARWIAYWSFHHGIPIRKGRVLTNGQVSITGVVRHSELGVLGGGHRDPGTNFDLIKQLTYARHYLGLHKAAA